MFIIHVFFPPGPSWPNFVSFSSYLVSSYQMVALARRDWMGLRRVLPQLLMATGNAEEAEQLLRQVCRHVYTHVCVCNSMPSLCLSKKAESPNQFRWYEMVSAQG